MALPPSSVLRPPNLELALALLCILDFVTNIHLASGPATVSARLNTGDKLQEKYETPVYFHRLQDASYNCDCEWARIKGWRATALYIG